MCFVFFFHFLLCHLTRGDGCGHLCERGGHPLLNLFSKIKSLSLTHTHTHADVISFAG